MKNKNKENNLLVVCAVCIIVIFFIMYALWLWSDYYEKNKNYIRMKNLIGDVDEIEDLYGLVSVSILDQVKEIEVDCSHEGFKGDSLIKGYKEVRELEKEDPTCIDQYYVIQKTFYDTPYQLVYENVNLLNKDCEIVAEKSKVAPNKIQNLTTWFMKCPRNNCKKKVVINIEERNDDIFEFVKLKEIGGVHCKIRLVMK